MKVLYLLPLIGLIHTNKGKFSCCGADATSNIAINGNRYSGLFLPLIYTKSHKNATGTSVIFPINISLIHSVFVLTSVPNVGERFTKT